jgi:glycosyltransferase involved in cell wall biosynthesis
MSKPRVFIVVASFYPAVGGIQTQAFIQSQHLRERGYEATIITFRHHKAWLRRETLGGVPVIRVAGAFLEKRERLPRVLQRLWYLLAMVVMGWHLWHYRHRYDLLHVYQLNLLALPVALVSWLTGKPMVVVVRCADSGMGTRPYKVSLARGPLDASTPWLYIDGQEKDGSDLESLERAGRPFVRLLHSLLWRIPAEVVILSSRMRDDLTARGFTLPKVRHIPNGVDTSRFVPLAEDAIKQRPQVVVCTSRLCYQKGIDVLLQAWRLVSEQLLSPAQLLIVGGGPIQSQLEYMAEALGIADSVEFAGEQRDIVAQLHRGAMGVLPSRWEGMPNALLEAMACGLPCVATCVSGSEDIIQSGVNGLLVEPEDYQELAQALLTLLNNPELARHYGRAARATVEAGYSLDRVLDPLIALYHKITNKPIENTTAITSEVCRKDIHSCVE